MPFLGGWVDCEGVLSFLAISLNRSCVFNPPAEPQLTPGCTSQVESQADVHTR